MATPYTSALEQVQIASPCTERWEGMEGDERVRFCGKCYKNVYNLSAMPRENAEQLVRAMDGRGCVRFYQRADGTLLTDDCPSRQIAARRRVKALAAGALAAGAVLLNTLVDAVAGPRAQPYFIERGDVRFTSGKLEVGPQPPSPPTPWRREVVGGLRRVPPGGSTPDRETGQHARLPLNPPLPAWERGNPGITMGLMASIPRSAPSILEKKPAPRVTLLPVRVEGEARDPEQIQAQLNAYRGALQACLQRAYQETPVLSSRYELEFTIEANGRTSDIRVGAPSSPEDGLSGCLRARIARWRFPKAEEAVAIVLSIGVKIPVVER